MSLVGTLRRFIGTRAASTVTAAQATPAAPPAPEAAPSIEELRQRAKRVYKEVSRLATDPSVWKASLLAVQATLLHRDASSTSCTSITITDHQLHRLGRDYPDENYNFNMRLRRAFESEYILQLGRSEAKVRHSLRPSAVRTGLDRAKIWRRPRLKSWHHPFGPRRLRMRAA